VLEFSVGGKENSKKIVNNGYDKKTIAM
jgi:hypothetical protein